MELATTQPGSLPPISLSKAVGEAAKVLDLCRTLEDTREKFLPALPHLDDETIIAVRMGAASVGVWAWLIEAACDAEMLNRVEKRTGKKVDESVMRGGFNEGREAVKRQQAYLNGKSSRTIERNAQIINTFGTDTIAEYGETLQDKGYFIACLTAPDPHEALEVLAEKKTENPFMEVKDAYKEIDAIKGKHTKAKRELNEAVTTIGRRAAYEWLQLQAEPALEALIRACPIPGFGDRVFKEAIKQCEEQRDALYLVNAQECLLYVWTKGYHTETEMKEFTRLPSIEIRRVMDALTEKGFFVEKQREWKAAGARGGRVKEWCRTAKPMPPLHINLPSGPISVEVVR